MLPCRTFHFSHIDPVRHNPLEHQGNPEAEQLLVQGGQGTPVGCEYAHRLTQTVDTNQSQTAGHPSDTRKRSDCGEAALAVCLNHDSQPVRSVQRSCSGQRPLVAEQRTRLDVRQGVPVIPKDFKLMD
jgi:hypothetical protein